MKYMITGATGFVGGRLARQLLEAGHQVVALVRSPARGADLTARGATLVEGDVTNKESVRRALDEADGVFHIAGWYKVGVRESRAGYAVNVEGTRNVLEAMREAGTPKGVYTSTLAVNSDTHGVLADESYFTPGPFLSEYERTKWLAHYEVAEPLIREGLPLVIVQPGVIYGPGDTSNVHENIVRYLRRRLPVLPLGTTYSWTYVDDVARGHTLAMERGVPGQSYIVAESDHTAVEAFRLAEQITGIPAPRLTAPPGLLKAAAQLMERLEPLLPRQLPATYTAEGLRSIAGPTYIGSGDKARRELGFQPRPFAEGWRETLLYEMEQLGMWQPRD